MSFCFMPRVSLIALEAVSKDFVNTSVALAAPGKYVNPKSFIASMVCWRLRWASTTLSVILSPVAGFPSSAGLYASICFFCFAVMASPDSLICEFAKSAFFANGAKTPETSPMPWANRFRFPIFALRAVCDCFMPSTASSSPDCSCLVILAPCPISVLLSSIEAAVFVIPVAWSLKPWASCGFALDIIVSKSNRRLAAAWPSGPWDSSSSIFARNRASPRALSCVFFISSLLIPVTFANPSSSFAYRKDPSANWATLIFWDKPNLVWSAM